MTKTMTTKEDILIEKNGKTVSDGRLDQDEEQTKTDDGIIIESDVSKRQYADGGWGWMIVFGCLLLRTIIGGFVRSSGVFYIKFLERFDGSAAGTAWVTSLSATVRLLIGPIVSILCNRFSCRKLTYFGTAIFVIAVHISGYATSLVYLYFSYGILGGFGRSFILTPLTLLLGEYFDKRRSLAFGLASAGFGIGGFAITPTIELMFQEYGFRGTYILLSGIACNLFVCASLFRPAAKKFTEPSKPKVQPLKDDDKGPDEAVEGLLTSYLSSTGSIHLYNSGDVESDFGSNADLYTQQYKKDTNTKDDRKNKNETGDKRKKLVSFSVLKDVRFVTLCAATFIFTLPSSGLFLPALAKSRGISDIQAGYLLAIVAGSDTVSRVVSGFILDLKSIRDYRPYIYNCMSFLQCIAQFLFPSLDTFEQFTAVCVLHGSVMGVKAAQRNVILVDILGVDKLASSFAFLLTVQGIGTLIGPPVAGLLKDTYGKYDYSFYFGGTCVLCGALILAGGNIRNYFNTQRDKK